MPLAPGTLIGQYRVHSLLGEGGMGAVYYAEHVVLRRPAAIKTLLPHIASDSGQVQRFINEARIAAHMNHRNIVDVLDCGMFSSPNDPNAQWYIALEYLRGVSLRQFIADCAKPIDLATIVHILGEAANGLHAAHERHQLVHRDVKPDNLFLIETEDDPLRVKVLDFGIAKLRQPDGIQTGSRAVMGTPAYASPEQLRESKDVDARADVWALGVVAHEMLTGVRPWGSSISVWEIITHHAAMATAPDPRDFRLDLPPKVAEVVSKAMEPDPNRRWRSTRDFARALAEAAPMPFSGTGMTILDRYAPELTKGSSHSLTAGRPEPAEVQLNPAEIVTGGRHPLTPPFTPPLAPPAWAELGGTPNMRSPLASPPTGPETRTFSTLGGSSGQAIGLPARRRRGWMFAGVALTGVAALAIAATFVLSHGPRSSQRDESPQIGASTDAGATRLVDAGSAASALAIVSDPDGANISVDGVAKGRAPLELQLPIGTEVEIRAELPGRVQVRRSVTVSGTPATVRLELVQAVDAVDAGTAAPSPSTANPPKGTRDGSPADRRRSKGSGVGSGSDFNPNDVL